MDIHQLSLEKYLQRLIQGKGALFEISLKSESLGLIFFALNLSDATRYNKKEFELEWKYIKKINKLEKKIIFT